jgi:hypothetical protein
MNARKVLVSVTALVAVLIATFPLSTPAEAAPRPVLAAAPMICNIDCRCAVVLGNENEETTIPMCYGETLMELLSSTDGCCDGSAACNQADDCSWTVKIDVDNADENECCYEIRRDGVQVFANSCSDSFIHQDSATAACGDSHLYVLRGEGAECPHDPDDACLKLATNVKLWEQRVHCQSDGSECP